MWNQLQLCTFLCIESNAAEVLNLQILQRKERNLVILSPFPGGNIFITRALQNSRQSEVHPSLPDKQHQFSISGLFFWIHCTQHPISETYSLGLLVVVVHFLAGECNGMAESDQYSDSEKWYVKNDGSVNNDERVWLPALTHELTLFPFCSRMKQVSSDTDWWTWNNTGWNWSTHTLNCSFNLLFCSGCLTCWMRAVSSQCSTDKLLSFTRKKILHNMVSSSVFFVFSCHIKIDLCLKILQ